MALRDQPYLPLYVQDFLTDEKLNDCSASANGVYIRLMCIMHKSEEYGTFLLKQKSKQVIFSTSDFASRLEKQMPFKEEVIAAALEELIFYEVIQVDGDRILQKRMVRDNRLSEVRAIAGKKGGEKTGISLSKMSSKSQANTESEYVNEIDSVINTKTTKKRIAKEKTSDPDFERFWSSYPKKASKKDADKAFLKTLPQEFETIMESLEKWKKSYDWTKDGGQYIPNAATWLNGERWNDEVPKYTGPSKQSSRQELPTDYCSPEEWLK